MRPRRVRMAWSESDLETVPRVRARRAEAARRRSPLRQAVTAVVLAVTGLLALAVTNLYMTLDSDEVRAWIAPRASAALNRPVTLGAAGISLWPRPSVRMTDVGIGNLPGFEGPMLARIDAARLEVAWLPLIVGRVHVRRLVLEGPHVHMAVDEHGSSNFGDLVPTSVEPTDPLPASVRLGIGVVSLSDGSLSYFDAHAARSMVVSGVDAEAALFPQEEGGWRTTLAARSDSLLVRFGGATAMDEEILRGAGPAAVLQAHGGSEPGTIEIDEGHIAFAEDTLAVYGAVSLGSPRPSFDLLFTDERVSAGFLTSLIPRGSRATLLPLVEGTLDVMLQLTGGDAHPPTIRGSVRLEDVGVRIRGEPLVENLSGLVGLTRDTIAFDSLAGRFAGGPFELSGTLARDAGLAAFVARAEPDLDSFERMGLLPEGTALSGDARVYVSLAGPPSALDSLELIGVAELTGLQLQHGRLAAPLYVPSGEVSLVGREARWSDLAVMVGHDRVVTSGRIVDLLDLWPGEERTPRVDLSLEATRFDVTAALPARDKTSTATYAQLALAHLGGRSLDEETASAVASARGLARPRRLPIHGSLGLAVDTLVLRGQTLDAVRARFELGDSVLSVPEASFQAWDGRLEGALQLGIGSELDEPFALVLSVEGADAASFFTGQSPVGDALTGTLDLRLDVRGSTDANLLPVGQDLRGEMDVALTNGSLRGTGVNHALADFLGDEAWVDVAFQEWTLDIGVQDRTLDIRTSSLTGDSGDVVLSGPLRLDGSADLAIGLSIPPEHLADVSLRRTGVAQSVLDRLRAAGGSLELGLRLSGWLQAPTLEPDASNAAALAR